MTMMTEDFDDFDGSSEKPYFPTARDYAGKYCSFIVLDVSEREKGWVIKFDCKVEDVTQDRWVWDWVTKEEYASENSKIRIGYFYKALGLDEAPKDMQSIIGKRGKAKLQIKEYDGKEGLRMAVYLPISKEEKEKEDAETDDIPF